MTIYHNIWDTNHLLVMLLGDPLHNSSVDRTTRLAQPRDLSYQGTSPPTGIVICIEMWVFHSLPGPQTPHRTLCPQLMGQHHWKKKIPLNLTQPDLQTSGKYAHMIEVLSIGKGLYQATQSEFSIIHISHRTDKPC